MLDPTPRLRRDRLWSLCTYKVLPLCFGDKVLSDKATTDFLVRFIVFTAAHGFNASVYLPCNPKIPGQGCVAEADSAVKQAGR